MNNFLKRILILLLFFCFPILIGQNLSKITTVEVDDLTDQQIELFWNDSKKQGYDINQVQEVLRIKGMSQIQIDKLKQRISRLDKRKDDRLGKRKKEESYEDETSFFGLSGEESTSLYKKDSLFGFDFFNNPNINFTPNLNVATPENYQLGPRDVVKIDVWGAAENEFVSKIDKQGYIQIPGVGKVMLSGMSFNEATSKVKSYLRRIYSGINAPNNSYNKVHVGVSLSRIRNVQVNVVGEVKTPGSYSLTALSTVLNALYAAGGPTHDGTFRKISLIRNGERVSDFDFYEYLMKGSEKGNGLLKDQDVIIVGAYKNLVKIYGQVKRPGYYQIKDFEKLSSLLSFCGGFTPRAYKNILVVQRVNGLKQEIKEVAFNDFTRFQVQDGDVIEVKEVSKDFTNKVSVKGAVYQPGDYEYFDGMTVADLIKRSAGIKTSAFTSRALITRKLNDVDKRIIPVLLNLESKVALKPNDELFVYSKDELRDKQTLTITGAVNKIDTTVDYASGMTVDDLIIVAGGLKEGADLNNIEVSRRNYDTSKGEVSKTFLINSSQDFKITNQKLELKPFDVVFVRYKKGFTPQIKVEVKGEVLYPGSYNINTKNERISDLIKRAGGLTEYAYAKGATLVRKKTNIIDRRQEDFIEQLKEKDSISFKNDETKKEITSYRIGIRLDDVFSKKNNKNDLILQEGDELLIPTEKQTVEVQGEVYSPSLVRFIPGKGLKYYIENAGGFTQFAKKNNSYVVYSNGNVDATGNFLFFKNYPSIEPGSTIIVPKKQVKKGMSTQEIIGITTGVATLGVLIDRLVSK